MSSFLGKATAGAVVDDADTWVEAPLSSTTPLYCSLKDLDKEMRCPICFEFFTSPVSVQPCLHTFCSECIRNRIKLQMASVKRCANCPVCRDPVKTTGTDFPVVANRTVEVMVTTFVGLRGSLKEALVAGVTGVAAATTASAAAGAMEKDEQPETGRRRSKRTSYKEEEEAADDADDYKEAAATQPVAAEQPRRTKKRRVNYSSLKKKQLTELCRQDGLLTTGSDKELRERHDRYFTLYNASCDSFQPKSVAALRDEVRQREKAIRDQQDRDKFSGVHNDGAKVNNMLASKDGKSGDPKFDAKMGSNFDKLIAEAKAKAKKKKGNVSESNEVDAADRKLPAVEVSTANDTVPSPSPLKAVVSEDSLGVAKAPAINEKALDDGDEQIQQALKKIQAPVFAASAPFAPTVLAQNPPTKRKAAPTKERALRARQKKISAPGAYREVSKAERRGSIVGPWKCQRCTFANETRTWSNARCFMCEHKRGDPVTCEENALPVGSI